MPLGKMFLALSVLIPAFSAENCTSRACWYDRAVRDRLAGRYVQAEAAFARALATADPVPTSTTIRHSLGILYVEIGRYRDAEVAFRQVLGTESTFVERAATLKQLGDLLVILRRDREAERMLHQALAALTSDVAGNAGDIARTWNSLGMLHYATGELSKAAQEYRTALRILESAEADARTTAAVLTNLGQLSRLEKRYAEAETYLNRALAAQEAALGRQHPHAAITLNHLGRTFADQGEYTAAEPLYLRALRIANLAGTAELPIVVSVRSNLAEAYSKRQAFPEAEQEYKRALASAETLFGATHPRIGDLLREYAVFLRRLKRKKDARELEHRAAAIDSRSSVHLIDVRALRTASSSR